MSLPALLLCSALLGVAFARLPCQSQELLEIERLEKRGKSVCSYFPSVVSPVIPDLYGLSPQRQPQNRSGSTEWPQLWKCHLVGVALSIAVNFGDAPQSLGASWLFYNLCQQIPILKSLYIFYFLNKTLIMPYFPICFTTNKFCFIKTVTIFAVGCLNMRKCPSHSEGTAYWNKSRYLKKYTFIYMCIHIFLDDYFP